MVRPDERMSASSVKHSSRGGPGANRMSIRAGPGPPGNLGRTGAPQLWCILDEGVLHRAIGGSKVMRSQLYRLAEVAEHPKTTIQVIRFGGAHAGCDLQL